MPMNTRGTVRFSKANAIFRLLFGLTFACIGVSQYILGGPYLHAAMISFVIAVLFIGYGLFALFFSKKIGSSIELETATPTERLNELQKMKEGGLISEKEFDSKRQEILKDL
jgi:hypothetical protein